MQLLFQQFVDRVADILGCSCHDSYAQCKLCSSGEFPVQGELQRQVPAIPRRFGVVDVPVIMQ